MAGSLLANAQGGAFTIKGHISGWKGKDSVYLTYFENNKLVMDSTIAIDGRFKFTGTIIQPVKAGVSARTRYDKRKQMLDHRSFFLDKGAFMIAGADSICTAAVAGSSVTRDYETLEQRIAPLFKRFVEVKMIAVRSTKESQATPEFKALEKEYLSLIHI